jgi:hypothetical protein
MSVLDLYLERLASTPFATAISEGATLFPWLECIHVVAITLVVGTIAIVDLRLLGYPAHRRSAGRLIVELLPYTWVAFGIAVVTGLSMFAANATGYAHNVQFQLKLALIALAGINMAAFHLTVYRQIVAWDEMHPPPLAARVAGAASLCLWTGVIFLGRWVGFTI